MESSRGEVMISALPSDDGVSHPHHQGQRRKRGKGEEEKADCKKEREEEEGVGEEDKSQRPAVRGALSSGTSLPR